VSSCYFARRDKDSDKSPQDPKERDATKKESSSQPCASNQHLHRLFNQHRSGKRGTENNQGTHTTIAESVERARNHEAVSVPSLLCDLIMDWDGMDPKTTKDDGCITRTTISDFFQSC